MTEPNVEAGGEKAGWSEDDIKAEAQLDAIFVTTDQNVESVREKMRQRQAMGLAKYGVTTERGDLSRLQWLRHAQEEAMDLAVYLERLIRDEEEGRVDDIFP